MKKHREKEVHELHVTPCYSLGLASVPINWDAFQGFQCTCTILHLQSDHFAVSKWPLTSGIGQSVVEKGSMGSGWHLFQFMESGSFFPHASYFGTLSHTPTPQTRMDFFCALASESAWGHPTGGFCWFGLTSSNSHGHPHGPAWCRMKQRRMTRPKTKRVKEKRKKRSAENRKSKNPTDPVRVFNLKNIYNMMFDCD